MNEELLHQRFKDLCYGFSNLNLEINYSRENYDENKFQQHIEDRLEIEKILFPTKLK